MHSLHGNGSVRYLSKNLAGLQSPGRLKHFLKHLNMQNRTGGLPIGACLAQEHNLDPRSRENHQKLAHHFRVLAIIAYGPEGETQGTGAAIFIPYSSIELDTSQSETLHEAIDRVARTKVTALAGRLAQVTTLVAGKPVQITAAYAPARKTKACEKLRVVFMKRLSRYLSRNTLLGIDANCVPDTRLDLRRDATSEYDNEGANELACAVARFGLIDTAREELGDEPFFTCHKNTQAGVCHSRIDQIYTPDLDDQIWTHKPAHDFWPGVHIDHDAISVTMLAAVPDRGHDVNRLDEALFDDVSFNSGLAETITSTWDARDQNSPTSARDAWETIKKRITSMADAETLRKRTASTAAARARDLHIVFLETQLSSGTLDSAGLADLSALKLERIKGKRECETTARYMKRRKSLRPKWALSTTLAVPPSSGSGMNAEAPTPSPN